jgi:thiamine biosynthesis lipoprotein ApbE
VFGGTRLAPWEIALPNGTAELRDGAIAVAISGQLITTQTGEVIHDRFDPRDGRPARQAGWVALVSERASVSAAYADAVFVMGAEGPAFVEERSELHAAIEDTLGKRWASSDLAVRD